METILHITDLHFGIEGVSAQQEAYRNLCLDSLLDTVKALEPDWKPTIICLTGDLVWRGAASEYPKTGEWLNKLLEICGLSYHDFVACVGNHEVDRNKAGKLPRPHCAKEADPTLEAPVSDFLEALFAEYVRFCKNSKIPALKFGEYSSYLIGERQIRGLQFIALNTAWYSKEKEERGKLWLGLPLLRYMEAHKQAPLIESASHRPITIALMHHPAEWLHPEEQHAGPDRPNALDYLAHRCHILLTGHTHGEVRSPDRIAEGAYHFTGGATYAGSDYRNCFRLLQIDDHAINYRSVEFDPRAIRNKWKISEQESIIIAKDNDKSIDLSSSKPNDKESVRTAYLQWLLSCHEQIELRGVQYSHGGTVSVPLQQIYLALQADASTALERAAARDMLMAEVYAAMDRGEIKPSDLEQAIWRIMAGSPNMPALESRDRLNAHDPSRKHLLNLAQAYFDESYLVILGDPGSGKTTLARWLALVSAKAATSEYLSVPVSQVDPEEADESKTTTLGLTRLPVLVRVADYAEARNKAKNSGQPIPALTEFLGWHKWLGQMPAWHAQHPKVGTTIDGRLINDLIQDALLAGKALIILDGLDEIPDSSLRDDIVEEVDKFSRQWIHPWVRGHKILSPPQTDQAEIVLLFSSFTANQLGNRLVVTSRIAGYQQAPLRGNMLHVTVEPMNLTAVKKFITHWMRAVHQALHGANPTSREAADRESQQFLDKLQDPRYFGAKELATNPLLCSLLATIFRHGNGDLPQRRVELYQQAIDKLVDIWLRRERDQEENMQGRREEMFAILEPIAEYIHQHNPAGLLPETELKRQALEYLAVSRGELPSKPSSATRTTIDGLMRTVREDVGLLAERGDKTYGFLHLTFQEYLAACALLRDSACAAGRIAEHLSDARWREVIRLALGEANRRDPRQLLCLAQALLIQESGLQDLLPQAALAIIAALPDIDRVQDELIETLAERLIQAYAKRALLEHLPSRRELLESALRNLITGGFEQALAACFSRVLRQAEAVPDQAAAVAELLRRLDFYPPRLTAALQSAIYYDSEAWHWPIHAALRIGMTPRDTESASKLSPTLGSLPFRQALLDEPQLAERIRANPAWLRLLIALYGGIGDFETADSIDHYYTLAQFLQLEDVARNRYGPVLKERWGGENGDFIYNIALHLDTVGAKQKKSWDTPPKFSPELIFRDRESQLTADILKALRRGEPPEVLLPALQKVNEHRDDARLAWWILDANAPDALLLRQSACLQTTLVDATARCSPFLLAEFATLSEDTPPLLCWALFEASTSLVLLQGGQPLGLDLWKLASQWQPALRPYLLAELLLQYARGVGYDDVAYDSAVFADKVECSPQDLIAAYCLAPIAAHRHWDLNWYDWPMALLPPASCRDGDIPPSVLTSIELLPASLGFLRVWSLGYRLRPLVDANPDLLPDVIAACLGDVGERSGRAELLEIYQPELLQSRSPAQDAWALAKTVKNPYYRARALCRLARHIPTQKHRLLDEANAAAEAISEPLAQAQVLELLAATLSGEARTDCWHRCRAAIQRITDADNRARAWARLGLLASPADAKACFQQAFSSALLISDEFERGTTLRILAPVLRGHADLRQALLDAAKYFQDPILGARAVEDWNGVLRGTQATWSRHLASDHDVWAVLALMAHTSSGNATPQQAEDALWRQLADTPSLEIAEQLLNAAKTERLDCTLTAVQCLDGLLETGHAHLAGKLLPKLRAKAAEAIPFLERAAHSPNAEVAAAAALLLAEMRGLSEWVAPSLIEALKSRDDLTRLRATALLYSGPQEPLHRASVIGKNGLDALFSAAGEAADAGTVYIGNAINWLNERLVYDLAEQIKAWADELNQHAYAFAAEYALSRISHFEPQAFQQVLLELENGNARVKNAILISMAYLAKWDRLDEANWNALNEVMETIDLAALESPKYLVFQLEELCEIALEALQSSADLPSQIDTARRCLVARHGISFADIFRASSDERLLKLKAFGEMMFAKKTEEPARWSDNAAVARAGVAQAGFIELLCEWLIQALGENLNDPRAPHFERTFLLDLLAGAAIAAPASFARYAPLARLEPALIAVTQKNRTYTGRASAILLLGYYRRLSPEALPALRSALADVEPVREAAMESALLFRTMDDEVLRELTRCLYDESSLLALAAARLLTTLGRHEKASDSRRQRIVEALAEATRDPRSYRPVHFDAGLAPAPDVPKLNDFFYDALLKVAGYEVDRRVHNK